MYIIAGTKVVRAWMGRTADYCRMCRGFQPAKVVNVKRVGHVYYIPLGRGTSLNLEQTCESCGSMRTIQPGEPEPAVLRDRRADLEWLLAETNPNAKADWAERLSHEARLRSGTTSPQERMDAMVESFGLANLLLEMRTGEMRLDSLSGAGCMTTIVAAFGAAAIAETLGQMNTENAIVAALVVGGILGVFTLILIARDGGRYTKRKILPILARALRPIRPREEEIEQVLSLLRENDLKIGRMLTTQQIVDAMMFLHD